MDKYVISKKVLIRLKSLYYQCVKSVVYVVYYVILLSVSFNILGVVMKNCITPFFLKFSATVRYHRRQIFFNRSPPHRKATHSRLHTCGQWIPNRFKTRHMTYRP